MSDEDEDEDLKGFRSMLGRINFGLSSKKKSNIETEREIPLIKALPNWDRISSIDAKIVILKDITSITHLQSKMIPYYATNDIQIKIAPSPFSQGMARYAYYASVCNDGEWKLYIVKRFIVASENEVISSFLEQNEQNKIAVFLANRWNKTFKTKQRIEYLEARIVELEISGKKKYYNMEELAEGDWKKWSNNAGFIEVEPKQLLRFSKWTYEYTNKYIMVTDVQGVVQSDKYLLSDPALICADETRFTTTNLDPQAQFRICLEAINHGLKGILPDRPVSKKTSYHLHSIDFPT